eukprot:scaffold206306_cov40-Prasinocladus_malaysianus.AAC.1
MHLTHPDPNHGDGGDLDKCPFGPIVRAAEAELAGAQEQRGSSVTGSNASGTKALHKMNSHGSVAHSSAASSQLSGSLASALVAQGNGLGLAKLDRDEWTEATMSRSVQELNIGKAHLNAMA